MNLCNSLAGFKAFLWRHPELKSCLWSRLIMDRLHQEVHSQALQRAREMPVTDLETRSQLAQQISEDMHQLVFDHRIISAAVTVTNEGTVYITLHPMVPLTCIHVAIDPNL